MLKPEHDDWDEFHDPEIVDWKRVRAALEHENTLTNHRITWLLTSQAFLFAAFALVFQASTKTDVAESARPVYRYIMASLAITGVLVSTYLMLGIQTAARQHDKLENWWNKRAKEGQHPPLCGKGPRLFINLPYSGLPGVFIVAWLISLYVAFYDVVLAHAEEISQHAGSVAIVVVVVVIAFLLGRRSKSSERDSGPQSGA